MPRAALPLPTTKPLTQQLYRPPRLTWPFSTREQCCAVVAMQELLEGLLHAHSCSAALPLLIARHAACDTNGFLLRPPSYELVGVAW